MNKIEAKVNFTYCEETIRMKDELELSYLKLAERLHRIHLNRMYLPNFETFDDFLEEIKISKATASKMINIYLTFVVKYKIEDKKLALAGGWSVVAETLPYITSKTAALDWLVKCKHLTRADLRKSLLEKKTGIDMRDCDHEDEEKITFYKCKRCGNTHREYDEN